MSLVTSPAQESNPDYPNEEYLCLTRGDTVGVRIHGLSNGILNGEWDAIRTYNAGVWPTKYWPLMIAYNKTGFKMYDGELFYGRRIFEVVGIEFFMVDTWEYLRTSKSIVPRKIGLSNDSLRLARIRTILCPRTDQHEDSVDFVFLLSSDTSFVFETTVFVREPKQPKREYLFKSKGTFESVIPLKEPIYQLHVSIDNPDSRAHYKLSVPNGRTLLDTVLTALTDLSSTLDFLDDESYVYSIQIDVEPLDDGPATWTIRICPDCEAKLVRYEYQKYW